MKLTVTEFVTLDGVSQGPGSPEEDTSDGFTQGGWPVPHIDKAFVRQAAEWLGQADALLLGRRTYDAFARDWSQITDPNDPFTALMNSHVRDLHGRLKPELSCKTCQRAAAGSGDSIGAK